MICWLDFVIFDRVYLTKPLKLVSKYLNHDKQEIQKISKPRLSGFVRFGQKMDEWNKIWTRLEFNYISLKL